MFGFRMLLLAFLVLLPFLRHDIIASHPIVPIVAMIIFSQFLFLDLIA
ncbi:hypothetical protein IJ425_01425 [bacterium]|nr:hypothetical protein [bacterium]